MANGRISDPMNREEFKMYIRATLGEPIIELNVTEMQVDIAIDQALQYFQNYHYLGTSHVYYVHEITQDDINQKSFTVPDSLIGVTTVYDASSSAGMGLNTNIYSGAWQVNYDLLFNQGSLNGSFLSFYMNKTYYDMINSLLIGMKQIDFNQYQNKVYLHNTWENYKVGDKLFLDGFQITDPDEHPEVWSDRWLVRYAAAKLKRQWGENVSKFDATLPGGVKLNYERIIAESAEEIRQIEENLLRDYSEPVRDWIG